MMASTSWTRGMWGTVCGRPCSISTSTIWTEDRTSNTNEESTSSMEGRGGDVRREGIEKERGSIDYRKSIRNEKQWLHSVRLNIGRVRESIRGLDKFERRTEEKNEETKSRRLKTTAEERVQMLRKLLRPFFGRSDISGRTWSPCSGRRTFSSRSQRLRRSPWDSADSPTGMRGHQNKSTSSTPNATTGRERRPTEEADLHDSFTMFTVYGILRSLLRGKATAGAERDDDCARSEVSFFQDDFVDFECPHQRRAREDKGSSRVGMIRRAWQRAVCRNT